MVNWDRVLAVIIGFGVIPVVGVPIYLGLIPDVPELITLIVSGVAVIMIGGAAGLYYRGGKHNQSPMLPHEETPVAKGEGNFLSRFTRQSRTFIPESVGRFWSAVFVFSLVGAFAFLTGLLIIPSVTESVFSGPLATSQIANLKTAGEIGDVMFDGAGIFFFACVSYLVYFGAFRPWRDGTKDAGIRYEAERTKLEIQRKAWIQNCEQDLKTLTDPKTTPDTKDWATRRLKELIIYTPPLPFNKQVYDALLKILDFITSELKSADTMHATTYVEWVETLFHKGDADLTAEIRRRFVGILEGLYNPKSVDSFQILIRNFLQKLKGYSDIDFWMKIVDDPLKDLTGNELDSVISNTDLRTLDKKNHEGFLKIKAHIRSLVDNPETKPSTVQGAKHWLDVMSQWGL